MFLIHNGLYFTAMPVARTLKDIEGCIQYQMPFLVHVAHRPIAQLAVVYDARVPLLAIPEGEGSTRKFTGAYALHLTFAHSAHRQRVSHNGLEEACGINGAEETFCGREEGKILV